jgi:Homing endonuclease associated repeat/Sigma-70, region 4
MYDLYATGATLEEVGARFGLTRERVRQVFRDAGLPTRSITETQSLRRDRAVHQHSEEICAAFSRYQDVADVARELDIPRVVVKEVVEAHFPPPMRRRHRKAATPKYSVEELIACLREASAAVGGPLTVGGYARYAEGRQAEDSRSWPSTHTYVKRFGSWRNALLRARLPVAPSRRSRSRRKFSDQDCIHALREAAETIEQVPTITAYNDIARSSRGRLPSAMTITNRLGTWSKALIRARL